jgi:hypothetical protein
MQDACARALRRSFIVSTWIRADLRFARSMYRASDVSRGDDIPLGGDLGLIRLVSLLAALALGAALGLGATWAAIRRGVSFDAARLGAWTAHPRAAAEGRDPYAAALVAATGEIPLDLAEGVAYRIDHDSAGAPLDGTCFYRVRGASPRARFWTLTATSPDGRLIGEADKRFGYVSSEIVRDEEGGFQIMLGPKARAGDWISTAGLGPMALTLRLYDTPVISAAGAAGAPSLAPVVEKMSCP